MLQDDLILAKLIAPAMTYFQIRSVSEVLGARTSAYHSGDTIQSIEHERPESFDIEVT